MPSLAFIQRHSARAIYFYSLVFLVLCSAVLFSFLELGLFSLIIVQFRVFDVSFIDFFSQSRMCRSFWKVQRINKLSYSLKISLFSQLTGLCLLCVIVVAVKKTHV